VRDRELQVSTSKRAQKLSVTLGQTGRHSFTRLGKEHVSGCGPENSLVFTS